MRPLLATIFIVTALSSPADAKDNWFEASSEHFTVVSNGREGRAKGILEDLEQLRRLISEIFPALHVDGPKPAVFYVFKNEGSMRPYQPIVNGEREKWAGLFRPTALRDYVLVRGDGKSEIARQMVYGQYMHLLEGYNRGGYPVWLSNGLSRFYENTEISKKQASIGKMRPGFQRVLGEFRSLPIRELFAVDHSSDHYRDPNKRSLFDAQSWALVHYLLIGQDQNDGPRRLGQYMQMLRQEREPLMAFQEAMGMTLDAIDSDVALYIRKRIAQYIKVDLPPLELDDDFSITKFDGVAADAHLGQMFMAARYDAEAESSLSRSIEADPDQAIAYEAFAGLRERQDRTAESLALFERAIRNGSTNPFVHLRYGQLAVRSKGDDASAMTADVTAPIMESMRVVIRAAPELTEASRLFGFVSLFSTETLEEGESVVKRALEREPENASLEFILGQLYAKKGSYAAARVILKRILDRELAPAFTASVRRQFDFADAKVKYEAELAAKAAQETEGVRRQEAADGTSMSSIGGETQPQQAASAGAAPRLISVTSGSEGSQQDGIYLIQDPRTSFRVPQDKQVIVQFEWEGRPGLHHFEGRWKDPRGRILVTKFEYDSPGSRFGGYWSLDLPADVATGEWELEALVDGVVAGTRRIQIATGGAPD